jgi:hypothetical protein
MPMPWMLGPIISMIIWRGILGHKTYWPVGLRNAGLVILGYTMGASFTADTMSKIIEQLPFMTFATVSSVLFSIFVGYVISIKTGIAMSTSLLGNVPGGLSQMVVLGEDLEGADVTVITFIQTIRLLLVVFLVPFIVIHGLADNLMSSGLQTYQNSGGAAAYTAESMIIFIIITVVAIGISLRLKFPAPYLLGPILGVTLAVVSGLEAPKLTPYILTMSQVCIGTYMGLSFKLNNLKNWKRVLPYVLSGCLAIISFSLLIGFILTLVHNQTLIDAFLGTAPGGMAEMGITAILVNADLSIITAYQMFRFLFIMFVVPPLIKWWLNWNNKKNLRAKGINNITD